MMTSARALVCVCVCVCVCVSPYVCVYGTKLHLNQYTDFNETWYKLRNIERYSKLFPL
jgi:hypothetical protein